MYKSLLPIPECVRFRYFEVDVIENKADAPIYFGIIESKEKFINNPNSPEDIVGS